MSKNIVLTTDSYKLGHHQQYPKGTTVVYSYFEARNGAKWDSTVFNGLQYILKEYLSGQVVTREKIEEAAILSEAHFMNPTIFNREMWEHILNEHDGYLPVRIKAVPEGLPVPVNNVMMTVENTDPKCFALTNHLETILTHVWYPSTVGTLSREVKKQLDAYLNETSDNHSAIDFQLHDFGYRGTSSVESAGIGGLSHLLNFKGTDTVEAMMHGMKYYSADLKTLGFSVPATEHSIQTSLGKEGEFDIVQNMLDTYPVGIISNVADSYDIENYVKVVGSRFKEQILNRNHPEIPCKFVVRPDSVRNATDTPHEQMVWICEQLWEDFGGTTNSKNFRVLDPHVGVLWGDGIDINGICLILKALAEAGFSTENAVFGMGGGLLQKINRDTQRFAFKCSAQQRNNQWVDICKTPKDVTKISKKGKLKLVKDGDELITVPINDDRTDVMEVVFENGKLVKEYNFDDMRVNASL